MKKFFCRSDVFQVLTPEACYWAGVLASDGCIRIKGKNSRIVVLKVDDRSLVDSFKSFLQSEATIFSGERFNGKHWYLLQVSDSQIFFDLCTQGIVPNKSLTLKVSQRLAMDRDFWRGVMDGDGCLCIKSSGYFSLLLCSASWDFILQFSDFLGSLGIVRKITVDSRKRSPLYSIQLSGWQARTLVKELYRDCCMALDRKLSIAEAVMDAKGVRMVGVTAKEELGHHD
jgi:hypothetical protein